MADAQQEAKRLASTPTIYIHSRRNMRTVFQQSMGRKKRNVSLPIANGQQEAKRLASKPTMYTLLWRKMRNVSLPTANDPKDAKRFASNNHFHNLFGENTIFPEKKDVNVNIPCLYCYLMD